MTEEKKSAEDKEVRLFLCGDVMLGRGIDQILPHPNPPRIFEGYMRDARGYVQLAVDKNGPLPTNRDIKYVWGDAIKEFEELKPDVKIINLETAVTKSEDYWNKACTYRMHPDNVNVITAAGIDYCSLANNHVIDWGYAGLAETLETLKSAKLKYAGAGNNSEEAKAPAIMEVPSKNAKVIVYSMATTDCGVPASWIAGPEKPGVNLINVRSHKTVTELAESIKKVKKEGDIVVASIHWGGNWGFEVEPDHMEFAHALIDEANVDIIHGHSSHHVKGIEVYKKKLILYGCGDFIDDYEGIEGYEWFRGDLGLMYFPSVDPKSGELRSMVMTPTQMKKLRVNRVTDRQDLSWFVYTLNREGKKFGTGVQLDANNRLKLLFPS